MTEDAVTHRGSSVVGRFVGNRAVPFVAAGLAVALTAGALAAGGGAAGAASQPLSQSTGRFLSGSAAGTSFDTVAAIDGESAQYPSDPGPNQNDLNGSVLGMAIKSPVAGGLQIPGPGGVTFGAVAQYAKANSDGSAVGASGLIDKNGTIGTGGSGDPTGTATIDLAGLPSASALTSVLGDVKLELGAISAHAQQAAFGKTLTDPSADCTSGPYKRVSASNQAGSYGFASLILTANSPALKTLGTAVTANLANAISTFNSSVVSNIPLVTISGLPTAASLANDLSVSFDGITASLATGDLTIDLAALLKAAGLDLNNLCPNTSLLPYLAAALFKLPTELGTLLTDVATKLTTALGATTITIGPAQLSESQLAIVTAAITGAVGTLTSNLTSGLATVNTDALQPLLTALTSSLLDIVVNAQSETNGTFKETAVQLQVVPGGAALPAPPTMLPTLPIGPPPPSRASNSARAIRLTGAAAPVAVRHVAKPLVVAGPPLRAPRAAAAATSPLLELDLASATVRNDGVSSATNASQGVDAASTNLPTGVPAGQASTNHGTPALPLVLVLLALMFAGGGAFAFRKRTRFTH